MRAPRPRCAPRPRPRAPPPPARAPRAAPRAAPRRGAPRRAPPRARARRPPPRAAPLRARARARARSPSDARPAAHLQTYAKPMKKGGGMQLGKPKGELGGGAGLLAAMANEGEIMADDPSLAPAAGGAAAATPGGRGGGGADAPITLTFDEKLVVTMNRDGGLEGMELKGDLQLLVTDATMAKATVPVRPARTRASSSRPTRTSTRPSGRARRCWGSRTRRARSPPTRRSACSSGGCRPPTRPTSRSPSRAGPPRMATAPSR